MTDEEHAKFVTDAYALADKISDMLEAECLEAKTVMYTLSILIAYGITQRASGRPNDVLQTVIGTIINHHNALITALLEESCGPTTDQIQ